MAGLDTEVSTKLHAASQITPKLDKLVTNSYTLYLQVHTISSIGFYRIVASHNWKASIIHPCWDVSWSHDSSAKIYSLNIDPTQIKVTQISYEKSEMVFPEDKTNEDSSCAPLQSQNLYIHTYIWYIDMR